MHQKAKDLVADLTVGELRELVSQSVHESLADMLEDFQALASKKFVKSIQQARRQYKTGKVKTFEDIF